jgi:ubiquinone/menaquinone biosynthesis C-methylase UbiE
MSNSPLLPSRQNNTYFLDPENGAEMARLQHQDRMFTYGMGGLRPEVGNNFNGIRSLLDIGCGPGGWILDVAQANPKLEAVGIDVSSIMIEYAQMMAKVQHLHNASFRIMNVLQPLDFPDATFDLVNARFIIGFMPTFAWPSLLQECLRILKPGGVLRLTEAEMPVCPTPAMNQIVRMMSYALHEKGHTFDSGKNTLGITAVMGNMMRRAGYQNVRLFSYALEYYPGNELYDSFFENFRTAYKLSQSFIIYTGAATPAEVDLAYKQALIEIRKPDFSTVSHLLTAWGHKP